MNDKQIKYKYSGIDSIPNNWESKKLFEIGEINRGKSKVRPRDAAFLYGGKYPFIQTGDIKASGGRITSYRQTYSDEGLKQSRLWPKGTICITIAATIAETGILTFPACFPDSVIGFIPDPSKCDVNFVEYALRTIKDKLKSQAIGSVQDNINLETFKRIPVPLPSLKEQKKIAEILSSLDDKIELNKKINNNLEKIASSLFKRWFVDFEFPDKNEKPYKYSGGKMIDSELGKIPDGWGILKINEIANIEYGRGDYSKTNEGKYSVFGAGGLVGYSDSYEYENQQLIVGCRGTCGNISITDQYVTITHNSLIIIPKEKSNFNIYSLKKSLEFSEIKSVITGSTQPQITIKDLSSLLIIEPDKTLINIFNNFIIDSEKYILNKNNEIKKIEQIRNSLLSKLMSGKIRVK